MALRVKIIADDKFSGTLLRAGKGVARMGVNFVKFGALAGAAIAGVGAKLAMDMEQGLREVGTLMGSLSTGEMRKMTQELEHLAGVSGQAMDKLVKAKYDIVSAGFNDAASSAKLLAASADLAVGGVTEVSTAADVLTTALNAYNMTAGDAIEVSDKLFTIVRLGKTTMNELGGSLGRVFAIAGQAGVSLDEVGAAMATLTASGQKTEEATTAVRAAIVTMLKPTSDLQTVIEALGYDTGKAMIESLGFADALNAINRHAKENNLQMTDLFTNIRAMQAVLPLVGGAAEKFAENLKDMEESTDATANAVEEMQKSFKLQMNMLRQNVNNIMRTIGRAIILRVSPAVMESNKILSRLGKIGWEAVAMDISENWGAVMGVLTDITAGTMKIVTAKIRNEIELLIMSSMPLRMLFGKTQQEAAMASVDALAAEYKARRQVADAVDKGIIAIQNYTTANEEWQATLDALMLPDFEVPEVEGMFFPSSDTLEAQGEATLAVVDTIIEQLKEKYRALTEEDLSNLWQSWNDVQRDMDLLSFDSQKEHIDSIAEQYKVAIANKVTDEKDAAKQIDKVDKWSVEQKKKIEDKKEALQIQGVQNTAAALTNVASLMKDHSKTGFMIWKRGAQFQALVDTYAAANAAYKAMAGIPIIGPGLGAAAAAAAATAGLVNVAQIEKQTFAFGGRVQPVPAQDTVPALLTPGEQIATPAAARLYGSEIDRMNQIAEGGDTAVGGGSTVVNVYTLSGKAFLDTVKESPDEFAEAIEFVRKRGY